jgi:hypothetical protein
MIERYDAPYKDRFFACLLLYYQQHLLTTSFPHLYFLSIMVNLTGTITAVSTLAGGMWVVCAASWATAGWTAPACLIGGVASGLDLILGIVQDSTGSTKTGGNNPDQRSSPKWHRLHLSGELENLDDRLHELFGSNETIDMIDMHTGHKHQMWMEDGYATVRSDLSSLTSSQSEGCGTGSCTKTRRGYFGKRETDNQRKHELDHATYKAQKVGSHTGGNTHENAERIATDITNGVYGLGTYCTSILNGNEVVADIGLTLGGPGYSPERETPPCEFYPESGF